jgi:hypothetical protein
MFVNHNNLTIKNHIVEVKNTCHNQVTSEALPVSLIILAFSHIHTIKRSRDIHICENTSKISQCCKKFNIYGHRTIHDKIYHIINGCFSSLTMYDMTTVIHIAIQMFRNASMIFV